RPGLLRRLGGRGRRNARLHLVQPEPARRGGALSRPPLRLRAVGLAPARRGGPPHAVPPPGRPPARSAAALRPLRRPCRPALLRSRTNSLAYNAGGVDERHACRG